MLHVDGFTQTAILISWQSCHGTSLEGGYKHELIVLARDDMDRILPLSINGVQELQAPILLYLEGTDLM